MCRRKYAYNSGLMLQAAVRLCKATADTALFVAARLLAGACFNGFFVEARLPDGILLPKSGNLWFHAVMLRGFVGLYGVAGEGEYPDAFDRSFDHAWRHARDADGLFHGYMRGHERRRKGRVPVAARPVRDGRNVRADRRGADEEKFLEQG
jgi:uncharacterized protein YyaL (SSP411 family)